MTMPRTSPMAQPVRQCRVARTAVRLRDSGWWAACACVCCIDQCIFVDRNYRRKGVAGVALRGHSI